MPTTSKTPPTSAPLKKQPRPLLPGLTLSPSEALARISQRLPKDSEPVVKKAAQFLEPSTTCEPISLTYLSGKTFAEPSPPTKAGIFKRSCKRLPTLGVTDLNGNCLILDGFYPNPEPVSTLSDILMERVAPKYFLSARLTKYLQRKINHPKQTFNVRVIQQP